MHVVGQRPQAVRCCQKSIDIPIPLVTADDPAPIFANATKARAIHGSRFKRSGVILKIMSDVYTKSHAVTSPSPHEKYHELFHSRSKRFNPKRRKH